MALTALPPRDNSPEEKERYAKDMEDKKNNPVKWGDVRLAGIGQKKAEKVTRRSPRKKTSDES